MRFFRKLVVLCAITVAAWPLAAQEKLSVVATTGMIADAAREVGGDLVDVTALMGPGIDPHAYRQTRTDILSMARADLILWNGLNLEAQMEQFLTDAVSNRSVVAVAEAVDAASLKAHDDYSDKFDPHVWMDPTLWAKVVGRIETALSDVHPEQADVFAANAAAYLAEIGEVATYASEALVTVPEQSRVLLSAHDAFGYFGAAYDFDVMGVQGISTESEAGLFRISELVDFLVERQIKAVFVETSVSDRAMRAVIEGAAAQGHEVVIGGELFSDAMGPADSYEGTYVGMINHNATVITRALGGSAPERGFNNLQSEAH